MPVVNNSRTEITITREAYEKMIRADIAARMAINLLRRCAESGYLRDSEMQMLLDEFGADFQ